MIFLVNEESKNENEKNGRERERESELSEFIFSYWIFFGERNRMDLGIRGIYDLHHQCIPKKN